MQVIDNANDVARKAWSVRWMALAMIVSGVDALIPFFGDFYDIPPELLKSITALFTSLALITRFIAQKGLSLPAKDATNVDPQ
jgi:hypothetical protein